MAQYRTADRRNPAPSAPRLAAPSGASAEPPRWDSGAGVQRATATPLAAKLAPDLAHPERLEVLVVYPPHLRAQPPIARPPRRPTLRLGFTRLVNRPGRRSSAPSRRSKGGRCSRAGRHRGGDEGEVAPRRVSGSRRSGSARGRFEPMRPHLPVEGEVVFVVVAKVGRGVQPGAAGAGGRVRWFGDDTRGAGQIGVPAAHVPPRGRQTLVPLQRPRYERHLQRPAVGAQGAGRILGQVRRVDSRSASVR